MSRRNRDRKPARRREQLDARQRILAVCEGERTEPEYIKGFRRWCRNPLVEIEVIGPAGVPWTLVNSALELRRQADADAKRQKDENLRFDQVWCVFDRDEHPKWRESIQKAVDNGLHVAFSNPSFELWLLLHFSESPGLRHRDEMKRFLKKHVPDYDKAVDFDVYRDRYFDAHDRAARLDGLCQKDGEPFRNPSTGFYLLTDQISLYADLPRTLSAEKRS